MPELTEEEYLHDSECEHCEYIDGHAVKLNIGTSRHGSIEAACGCALHTFCRKHGGGRAYFGLHCKLMIDERVRYRLPDVAVILDDRSKDFIYYEGSTRFRDRDSLAPKSHCRPETQT